MPLLHWTDCINTNIMEGSKLIFSLDCCEEGPVVSFSKDKPQTDSDFAVGMDLKLNQGRTSQAPSLPHSPSSPGSLADMCSAYEPLTTNLVKSSSSDLEPKEDNPVKGKPLLSLVKSLSTEISRRVEHDENLSKSDSKLHLYPRKQFIHQKIPEARPDEVELLSENDPSSMDSSSPIESKGTSLIAELEDTRRKFSEAMQDPLSMFSKMIGDESPKQGRSMSTGDSTVSYMSDLKSRKKTDSEHKGVFDSHIGKFNKRSFVKSPITPEHQHYSAEDQNETGSSNVMQVLEDHTRIRETNYRSRTCYQNMLPGPSLPLYWLLPVGLLAYGFLVLPLPSYVTGLSVGMACGFLLGLIVVYMFAPRQTTIRSNRRRNITPVHRKQSEEGIIEGWMNETCTYDAETFHPSATHSVYVSLEGSRLELSLPSANICRWASLNETPPERSAFVHSRVYQLTDCKVSLLPSGLARKRIWNKKYPICIILAPGEVDGREEGKDRAEKLVTLYLFGRTGRDKEEWFQHFLSASKPEPTGSDRDEGGSNTVCIGETVQDCCEELVDLTGAVRTRTLVDYNTYMAQLIDSESYEATPSPTDKEVPSIYKNSEIPNKDTCGVQPGAEMGADLGILGCSADGQPHWVNSLVGRIFWDFLREKYWTDQVAHKIQKKLSKIKLPYFMNELKLADLDMGTCLPQVISTSKPALDRRGLWLEMEVMYTGGLKMTLETKMNLCKLGKDGEVQTESLQESLQFGCKPRLSILADSDEESSSAGSSEEEDVFEPLGPLGEKSTVVVADGGNSTGRKILRFVDKIAKSKYFQKATENEYIKKKIAEVSNMPLMLSVEVQELSGTLAINIPPPPTDRIWYSFRVPPRLDLHVRPMLGEREVTFTHVTEWIEKKLQCEFQKVLVMPNMDDLYLPLMTSSLESTPVSQHSSVASSQQSSIESQEYLSE